MLCVFSQTGVLGVDVALSAVSHSPGVSLEFILSLSLSLLPSLPLCVLCVRATLRGAHGWRHYGR